MKFMSKRKNKDFKTGDIVLTKHGEIFRIVDDGEGEYGIVMVHFIDRDEYSHIDPEEKHIEKNFGSSDTAVLLYTVARSIHLRLNRIAKI